MKVSEKNIKLMKESGTAVPEKHFTTEFITKLVASTDCKFTSPHLDDMLSQDKYTCSKLGIKTFDSLC